MFYKGFKHVSLLLLLLISSPSIAKNIDSEMHSNYCMLNTPDIIYSTTSFNRSITINLADIVSDSLNHELSILEVVKVSSTGSNSSYVEQSKPLEFTYRPNNFLGVDVFMYTVGHKGIGKTGLVEITSLEHDYCTLETPDTTYLSTTSNQAITINLEGIVTDSLDHKLSILEIVNITSSGNNLSFFEQISPLTFTYNPNGHLGADVLMYTIGHEGVGKTGLIEIMTLD
ncbi:hypothetical protein C0W35_12680 [Photobacterium kishitanii]|uniref:Uncharacterized protein n=1 Tax=Photobacterium kishitanii TaxID=318456 RepID=A0A0B7JIR7_9GAMM|nr:hypothetical protein [Photobacterium kishitanii]PSU91649.1 hypothetical protein C0W42_03030 [Photobacterium kishitanii]PSU92883.1 hypothetical protein C0W35_12680 [Photobacterium kishitanii]PSV00086.1 hypothetical protein C9J27_07585 [Photobacterium kishitanii]CEO41168.1 exported hypothetical protein [Photobacterium kishitanii]